MSTLLLPPILSMPCTPWCAMRSGKSAIKIQAPDALVAGSVLTAMSMACQGNIDVLLPTGLIRPPSLFFAMFGQSGERKTTVDNLVCTPIHEHDRRIQRQR